MNASGHLCNVVIILHNGIINCVYKYGLFVSMILSHWFDIQALN